MISNWTPIPAFDGVRINDPAAETRMASALFVGSPSAVKVVAPEKVIV